MTLANVQCNCIVRTYKRVCIVTEVEKDAVFCFLDSHDTDRTHAVTVSDSWMSCEILLDWRSFLSDGR